MERTSLSLSLWLGIMALFVVIMISVGGITRLRDAGLSIVSWKPVTGVVPPLSDTDWEDAFSAYRASPEFIKKFPSMTLSEFKDIYWWEYGHRLLGRVVGLLFFVPFLLFLLRKKIPKALIPHLVVVFVLGGLQGAMGWYMVKSGLVDEPYVSPLRLMAHLALALGIYAYLIALIVKLNPRPLAEFERRAWLTSRLHGLLGFLVLTILSGALVAGLDAGLVYNTFPLMDGDIVPAGYFALQPWYENFFRDIPSVQFHHRLLGMLSFAYAVMAIYGTRKIVLPRPLNHLRMMVLILVTLQVCLGILTLVYVVPLVLAVLHQLNAVLLFTVTWTMFCRLRGGKNDKKNANRGNGPYDRTES